ncbi:hypothetical protein CYMTET_7955 [Cymbomonas tetramitiformis]|uniref:Uncharacterized protein n=1 Tax=Cymbomonas tetramitiformis TaxID=36881 RepID=A0AAE0GU90_9CHLO|nr:hypothetical protein CYMTET_7955 [Cymbomonas tetramitiformis]
MLKTSLKIDNYIWKDISTFCTLSAVLWIPLEPGPVVSGRNMDAFTNFRNAIGCATWRISCVDRSCENELMQVP